MDSDTKNETRGSANYHGLLSFERMTTLSLTLLIVAALLGKGNPAMSNHLPKDRQVQILNCLVEGNSVRSTSRLTGAHLKTILDLLVRVGEGCAEMHDEYCYDVTTDDIQCDELWSFVGKKQKKVNKLDPADATKGDTYTYLAIDRQSKLIVSWLTGKRNWGNTVQFIAELAARLADGVVPQISTDGWKPYRDAIERAFGTDVHYGRITKSYAGGNERKGKYSPADVVDVEKATVMGHPDTDHICTSHAERCNLSVRMATRRFTRLTNGFSKKFENLVAAVNLWAAHYNYCRPHSSLKGITPAMAAGITDHVWTLEELIDEACPPWAQKKAA
jgi:IS1 family transposase